MYKDDDTEKAAAFFLTDWSHFSLIELSFTQLLCVMWCVVIQSKHQKMFNVFNPIIPWNWKYLNIQKSFNLQICLHLPIIFVDFFLNSDYPCPNYQ